jgi:hypothetical protein
VDDRPSNKKSLKDTGENLSLGRGGCGLKNGAFRPIGILRSCDGFPFVRGESTRADESSIEFIFSITAFKDGGELQKETL